MGIGMSRYEFFNGQLRINKQTINIPNITFIEKIGNGANAVVLKGHDILLKRDVAVKIWLPRKNCKYPNRAQFIGEIRKISFLVRPQIVQIYSADIINEKYCYAILEFVDGLTLEKWLSQKRDLNLRLVIAKKIFEELIFLHKLKIFHGDLHDKNIMITKTGEIKLLDFGTSIFCKKRDPHIRERTVLLETLQNIFSYEDNLNLLDIHSLQKSPSECIPYAIYTYTRILDFLIKFDNKNNLLDKKTLVFACYTWITYIPFFNIQKFLEVFKIRKIEPEYQIYFFSLMFCQAKSPFPVMKYEELKPLEINETNLKKFSENYAIMRAQFIKQLEHDANAIVITNENEILYF